MSKDKTKKTKFWDGAFGSILLFLIIYIISNILITFLDSGLLLLFPAITPFGTSLIVYISVAVMGLVPLVYMILKDKKSLETMLPRYGNNNIKMASLGIAMGFLANLGLVLMACGTGDIKLQFKGMGIGHIIVAFIFVALQCIGEEIMVRVFLLQRLNRARGPIFAIMVSSIVFPAMHILNLIMYKVPLFYGILAMLNIFLIAIFFSETVILGKNVYVAFGFHTAWNFCQAFVLGLPNSGNPSPESVWAMDGSGRNSLWYSTEFGIEATVSACILFAVLIVAVYITWKKRPQPSASMTEDAA